MHFTLLVGGALLPRELAAALTASLDTPKLKARLARASVDKRRVEASVADHAHLDWLAVKLFGASAPIATAPYAYAELAGTLPAQFILHADPVHIELARDHLVVQGLGANAPSAEETQRLIKAANALAPNDGDQLIAAGSQWFLVSEHNWHIEVTPLTSMTNAALTMPTGRDAPAWNRWHNEIQMAWHAHPVNARREADGTPTINGLWLHGGGRWQPLTPIGFAEVQSDAPEWRGAAHAAGARGLPVSALVSDNALVVVDQALIARRSEDWTGWLRAMNIVDQMLGRHPDASVDIVLCGNSTHTFVSRQSDRYKPWRRRTLAEALTE